MNKKQVLVCEFRQETDTFNPFVTPLEHFSGGEGPEALAKLMDSNCAVCGAVDAITQAGGEVIPSVFIYSVSGGPMADRVLAHMCERVQAYIKNAEQIDAVYVSLHGATCTESHEDACGDFLQFLREQVGDVPISASCDLHAKITRKMLKNADMICGYQTYPHLDFYETGFRAAQLCMELLSGKTYHKAVSFIPMLVPPAGYTHLEGAFKALMDRAKAMVAEGTLADFSIFPVQPWLDVQELASSVLTVAETPEIAKQTADSLARELFAIRDQMWPEMKSIDEILDIAEKNETDKPVVLADAADSPRGGAVGDSPAVLLRLLERKSTMTAAMFLRDPAAVEQAFKLGIGGKAEFSLGACMTPGIPGPAVANAEVLSLHESGAAADENLAVGKAAVLALGNIRVVVCEKGSSSHTPAYYQGFGIKPKDCRLLVVKANTSFRVPYGEISDLLYVGDTPGAGASNLRQLQWKNIPKGMYPFADGAAAEPAISW